MSNLYEKGSDKYVALSQLCVDYSTDSLQDGMTRAKANEIIRKTMVDIIGTETPNPREFAVHENTIYSIIETTIDQRITEGWPRETFFEQFVEYKGVELGDKNEFYAEDRTQLVVSEIANGTFDLNRQELDVGQTFNVPVRTYGVSVYASLLRFLAGRVDYYSFIDKIYDALNNKIKTEIYVTFMATYDSLPTELKWEGHLSEEKLLDIVELVSATNGNAEIILAGTRKALRGLKDVYSPNWISEEMKEQRNRFGEIRAWEGLTLLTIPQVIIPNTISTMIDDNKILILPVGGTRPIKFFREGQTMIMEDNDLQDKKYDLSKEYKVVTRWGMAIIFNNYYGMYKIKK